MSKFKEYISEEESNSKEKIDSEIMHFLAVNPTPPDDEVHKLGTRLGLEPDEFESKIYAILGSILGAGMAKRKGFTEKDASKKELEMGIKVEMEHTKNKAVAKRIALDHLSEMPDYYTKLVKMEKEGEK